MKAVGKTNASSASGQAESKVPDAAAAPPRKSVPRSASAGPSSNPLAAPTSTASRGRVSSASRNASGSLRGSFNPLKQVLWARPGFLVRRLHQIHDALFSRECQTHNITPVQFGILTALSMNPWLDQKAIGHELALDRTTTADVLKRLEDKGLIERRVNPDDRRSRLSVITNAGLKTLSDLNGGMQAAQEDLLAPLSELNRLAFSKLLGLLVEAHESVDKDEA
jgi:DNA-binding MarR family transcriptional regulator